MRWEKDTAEKQMRRRTFAYLWLFLGMMAMLVSSSFAWFTISGTPRVSDMAVYANAPAGLELATDYAAPDDLWGQNISFPELISDVSPLRPVTWSDKEQCFKAIRYGLDGRQTNRWRTLTDQDNANKTGDNQYYVFGDFYARTDTACKVSLADAIELNNGVNGAGTYVIGAPVWNPAKGAHENTGYGAEYAVRIGFMVTQVDPDTGVGIGESEFYIYEPNADTHVDRTVQYLDTSSIDGTETLVSRNRLLVQSTSSWLETTPVQKDATIKKLGQFTTNAELFTLEVGEIAHIRMYIWVEGQDLDCYGLPEDASLFANIQFKTDYTAQSGLEEIPRDASKRNN